MKRKLSRLLVLCLIFAMAGSLLTACNKAEVKEPVQTQDQTTETKVTDEQKETTIEPADEIELWSVNTGKPAAEKGGAVYNWFKENT